MRYIYSIIVESYSDRSPFKESLDELIKQDGIAAVQAAVMALADIDERKPVVWMVEE